MVSGIWREERHNLLDEADACVEGTGLVGSLRQHRVRVVEVHSDIATCRELFARRQEWLGEGEYEEEKEKESGGENEVLFQFTLLCGFLTHLMKEAGGGEVDAGGAAEIEKMNQDWYGQGKEGPQKRRKRKIHRGVKLLKFPAIGSGVRTDY